jgi:TPR repeat protein
MGNSDAAVALGIAAGRNGDAAEAYQWFDQAANAGDQTGLLLQGRAQLYGVGTTQDFQEGTKSLLDVYGAGNSQAAWDLAKATSYDWAGGGDLPSPQALWTDALKAGDPVVGADYARFLRAGGEAANGYQNIDQIVAPISELDPALGAIAAWDFGRASFEAPSKQTLDALKAASDVGNIDAAARYGDWLVSSDRTADQQLGLGYLAQAAQEGQSAAFTSLGKFYLGQPENTELAFDNLMTGLKLGDTDAGVPLADYYIAKNEFGQAYDYSLLAATSGTARGSSEAEMKVLDICQSDAAKCTEVTVAFVTSRQHDDVDGQIRFNGLPSDDFAPTYGFAKVLVAARTRRRIPISTGSVQSATLSFPSSASRPSPIPSAGTPSCPLSPATGPSSPTGWARGCGRPGPGRRWRHRALRTRGQHVVRRRHPGGGPAEAQGKPSRHSGGL